MFQSLDRLLTLRHGIPPRRGRPAPELGIADAKGKVWTLADLKGKTAVVFFYPADDTPGCTQEACAFRDQYEAFSGTTLLGVSTDVIDSHRAFAGKFNLPFPLLSDVDGKVSRMWGVRSIRGSARRVTFVIDRGGVIRWRFDPVEIDGHNAEVLAAIAAAG